MERNGAWIRNRLEGILSLEAWLGQSRSVLRVNDLLSNPSKDSNHRAMCLDFLMTLELRAIFGIRRSRSRYTRLHPIEEIDLGLLGGNGFGRGNAWVVVGVGGCSRKGEFYNL